jgi:hypothetical protein
MSQIGKLGFVATEVFLGFLVDSVDPFPLAKLFELE